MPNLASDEQHPSIRHAVAADSADIAELLWTVRATSGPDIPPMARPREKVESFVRDVLLPQFEVWVAEADDDIVGFMAVMSPDQRLVLARGLGLP